jgi:large subunit ribosomal protein L4
MATAPLYDATGRAVGETELADAVFGRTPSEALVHQAVVRELANRRQGTHDTKGRSEVRGGGKKPYRQKGTGRARQGSIRAPHWRHGGVAHGPTPRSHRKDMPQKMRRAAVLSALSVKADSQAIKVIETIELAEISTKNFKKLLDAVGLGSKSLILLPARDEKIALSARNLPDVRLQVLPGLSTLEVMNAHQILVTRAALQKLTEIYAGSAPNGAALGSRLSAPSGDAAGRPARTQAESGEPRAESRSASDPEESEA